MAVDSCLKRWQARRVYLSANRDYCMRSFISVCILSIYSFALAAQDYNILNFGAVADAVTLNTTAIQSAVDEANNAGGGKVIVPSGTFLTGTIVMYSGVELHFQEGAILLGSIDLDDYIRLNRWRALIIAEGQHDIRVSGSGIIDGQGREVALRIDSLFHVGEWDSIYYNFTEMRPKYYTRPQIIEFVGCTNVSVTGVTLKDAACWVQTYDQCENVNINGITVQSDAYWNNDGIDISDCRNVVIEDCFVNSSDDGICLKSHNDTLGCDSIYITRCTVRSSASAVKLGSRSHGGFRNVHIDSIEVYDTYRSAVAIECVDGGTVENVLIENVRARNTGNAIFIRLGDRSEERPPGVIRNVLLRNFDIEVAFERPDYAYQVRGPALPFFHNTFPASITGIPRHNVENVVLENMTIRYPGRGNRGLAHAPLDRLSSVPECIGDYPEFSMFGELPAWGFYIRHVDGLVLRNIQLSIDAPDYRPGIVLDSGMNVVFEMVDISGDDKEERIVLRNAKHVNIDDDRFMTRR